jgi:hypothetical protein
VIETNGRHGLYATLSYCWGKEEFLTLKTNNHAQLAKGIDENTLPPTFRDALATARSSSIPYLWIDALCIIQNSDIDKANEIAKMAEIYSSSALTIVAASAGSVFEGFTHPREHEETLYNIPVRLRPGVFGTMSVNELDAVCYDERSEPISKRAWAMQEQVLSHRTLIFTSRTMMWNCHERIENFGDSLYFPHNLGSGYNDNDEKYTLNLNSLVLDQKEACAHQDKALSCWMRLVTAYSLRVTSLERDVLNALSGIASLPSFHNALGPEYFAGLWNYNLAKQLTWRTANAQSVLDADQICSYERPREYRAPSWSWASLKGGLIHFDHTYDHDADEAAADVVCEILECSTTPVLPEINPFGEIRSAHLRIRAPARKAWFSPAVSGVLVFRDGTGQEPGFENVEDATITLEDARNKEADSFKRKCPNVDVEEDSNATYGIRDETAYDECCLVLCVAITRKKGESDGVEGLLVLEDQDRRGSSPVFRRIGVFDKGRNSDFDLDRNVEIIIV